MLTKKIVVSTSLAVLVCGAHVVHADDDTGWYAGIGISRLDADFEDVADLSFDDSDDAVQIKGGYMFTDIWGLEAGYGDLGNYEGDSGIEIDADAFWLAGVANWAVAENWDLYAKLGVSILDAKSDQFIPGVGRVDKNQTEEEAFFGVGAEYDFGTWNIFGEYAVIDTDVSDLTIDVVTLGLKWEFGQ